MVKALYIQLCGNPSLPVIFDRFDHVIIQQNREQKTGNDTSYSEPSHVLRIREKILAPQKHYKVMTDVYRKGQFPDPAIPFYIFGNQKNERQ